LPDIKDDTTKKKIEQGELEMGKTYIIKSKRTYNVDKRDFMGRVSRIGTSYGNTKRYYFDGVNSTYALPSGYCEEITEVPFQIDCGREMEFDWCESEHLYPEELTEAEKIWFVQETFGIMILAYSATDQLFYRALRDGNVKAIQNCYILWRFKYDVKEGI